MLKTRPSASKTSVQMSDGSRMTSLVDFGWSRQSSDPDRIALNSSLILNTKLLYSTILSFWTLLDRCHAIAIELLSSASNFRLTTTAGLRRYLYRSDPRGGGCDPGGAWSIKAIETNARFHSLSQEPYSQHRTIDQAGDCLSTASHANAMGSYVKNSICLTILSITFPAILSMDFSRPDPYRRNRLSL